MAKIKLTEEQRVPLHKRTSQGARKGVKTSSMNKHKRRSLKFYNRQGK